MNHLRMAASIFRSGFKDADLIKQLILDKYGVPIVDKHGNTVGRTLAFDDEDLEQMDRQAFNDDHIEYDGIQLYLDEDQGKTGAYQEGDFPLSTYL